MTADRRYEVRIDELAEADLESIIAFLTERRDRADARAFVQALLERIDRLETFPLRGSVPKELRGTGETEVRQLVHRKYRVIYEVARSTVRIILVADGRRDMQALLRQRLLDADPPA